MVNTIAQLFFSAVYALTIPSVQAPVYDEVGFVSAKDAAAINSILQLVRDQVQVQVVVLKTIEGKNIEDASLEVARGLGLGLKEKGNGVLFLIAAQERRTRIEVGQGIEGDLTDIQTSRILRQIVRPYFKIGDTSAGIRAGVAAILETAKVKVPSDSTETFNQLSDADPGTYPLETLIKTIIYLLFFPALLLFSFLGRGRRGLVGGGIPRSFPGGFGSGSGGSGGWSGGGGGFSGGGSSGDW